MADRIMVKHLPVVESSFTRVIADYFRSILSQEGLSMECGAEHVSDDYDFICTIEEMRRKRNKF